MPIQRNPEKIIATLLEGVSKAKSAVPELDSREVEKQLQDMREIFPLVKYWEEKVIGEFDSLEQEITDETFSNCNQSEIQEKLRRITQKIQEIKKMNPTFQQESFANMKIAATTPSEQPTSAVQKMSKDWQRFGIEKRILESSFISHLQISYDNLDSHLKLCLLCFAIFPKNPVIKKRPLIYWWIGEGLVTYTNDKTSEEVGEDVLEQLRKKGMIKALHKNKSPMVSSYTMHPWIHRMVISVAGKAGFFDFDDAGELTADFPVSHRACFVSPSGRLKYPSSSKQEELSRAGLVSPTRRQADDSSFRQGELQQQSNSSGGSVRPEEPHILFNVNKKYLNIEYEWFSRQTKLVVLQLGRWQNLATHHIEVENTKFLNALGLQKSLKYLSLRGISLIAELPESIANLTALRILDLRACHNLEKLPSGIRALKKLTHLDVSECYLLEQMPKGLEQLSELQVLKGFVIGNSISKDPCGIRDLTKLMKLRKLGIIVGGDAVVAEEELGELKSFEKLRNLTIRWGGGIRSATQDDAAKTLKRAATMTMSALSVPKNLEKLDLRCFPKRITPSWLRPSELNSLKRLYITGGQLGSLGIRGNDSWNVQILRLKFLKELELEWSALKKAFPNLDYLETKECNKVRGFPPSDHGVYTSSYFQVM